MISIDIMDIAQYEIDIKHHAFRRAMERGVTPDMVESTLRGGKQVRFGRNSIKFCRRYKRFIVICIGIICERTIKIVTIEAKEI